MSTQGVDFAGAKPIGFGAILHAAGKNFAMRYLASDWRGLTPAEYVDLTSHGVMVGFISEGSGSDALGGFSAGVAAAQRAQAIINANHWPNLPIYFAVDFDAQGGQLSVVDQFLNGAASVVGRTRTGVYGSATVIEHCQSTGSAKRFWQTYAWSHGIIVTGIDLIQYNNGQTVGGQTVDLCLAFNTAFADDGPVTPIIESSDPDMPENWKLADGTEATIGGTWAKLWHAADIGTFTYASNMAAWGAPILKNMTDDELTTIVNECNARGAAYAAVTPAATPINVPALASGIAALIPAPTDNIDIPTLAAAIAAQLPHETELTSADITAAVKAVFAQAGA